MTNRDQKRSGFLHRWTRIRRASSAELVAKRAEKERVRVSRQLRAAGISERRAGGGGGLMSEPVLAFCGDSGGRLKVFDQDANQVGVTARRRGHRWELLGMEGNCLLVIERAKLRLLYSDYLIRGPDGEAIGLIAGRALKKRPHRTRPVIVGGDVVGTLRLERSRFFRVNDGHGERGSVVDTTGDEVARLLRADIPPDGKYVLEITPSAAEPLRTVAIAAIILWDLTAEVSKSGG
jgi:hypothetical protein